MFQFGKKINKKIEELASILPSGAEVLDLGCGAGASSIFLAEQGFSITCVDANKETLKALKKTDPDINVFEGDILDFEFLTEKYDAILMLNVLHFFNLEQIGLIIKKVLKSLKKGGLLYLQVFSIKDPSFNKFLKVAESKGGKNTFYSKKMQSFAHFFEKEELQSLFVENEILEIEKETKIDNHPPVGEHKHVVIKMTVRK